MNIIVLEVYPAVRMTAGASVELIKDKILFHQSYIGTIYHQHLAIVQCPVWHIVFFKVLNDFFNLFAFGMLGTIVWRNREIYKAETFPNGFLVIAFGHLLWFINKLDTF